MPSAPADRSPMSLRSLACCTPGLAQVEEEGRRDAKSELESRP